MEASPRDKGIELVKRASEEDAKKNYKEALSLYRYIELKVLHVHKRLNDPHCRLGIEYLILAAKRMVNFEMALKFNLKMKSIQP